jgi:hypothetical protein
MVASIPAYNRYASKVLMPAMDQKVLAEIKQLEAQGRYDDPRYEELLIPNFYVDHILRMPAEQWPDPVVRAFAKINKKIYIPMQGPSEMGASGKLVNWDRTADLPKITVPTLSIGARYDTMEPAQMEKIAKEVDAIHSRRGCGPLLTPEETQPERGGDRLRSGMNVEFAQNCGHVAVDGLRRAMQPACNVRVAATLHQQRKNFEFLL